MGFAWRRWVNLHTIFALVVILAALYYAWRAPKRRYPFAGIKGLGVRLLKRRPRAKRQNKSEEKCRRIFEKLFRRPFKTVRPAFLKSPATGKNLELDGFCADVRTPLGQGLAFEYDGVQHAKYKPHFHRGGPREFIYQQKKDTYKDVRCREKGILLIRIPHFVPSEELERYIRGKLIRAGVPFYP